MSEYKVSGVGLENKYATGDSTLKSNLTFSLNQLGYKGSSPDVFVKSGSSDLPGWGKSAGKSGYKYGGVELSFATKDSCPVPVSLSYQTDNWLSNTKVLASTVSGHVMQLKYKSSDGCCYYTTASNPTDSDYVKVGSGFTGVFIFLQGGGGGGGGAVGSNMTSYTTGMQCAGSAGGGGAFITAYLDLSAIPDSVVQLVAGHPGTAWGDKQDGQAGGDSYLSYNNYPLLIARGGGQGLTQRDFTWDPFSGGNGGACVVSNSLPSWIKVLDIVNGGKGGDSSGTVNSSNTQAGNAGVSISDTDKTCGFNLLNSSNQPRYRRTTSISVGSGSAVTCYWAKSKPPLPTQTQWSIGAGGGASALGGYYPDPTSTSSNPPYYWYSGSYGYGGNGGSAKCTSTYTGGTSIIYQTVYEHPESGGSGIIGIFKTKKL